MILEVLDLFDQQFLVTPYIYCQQPRSVTSMVNQPT